MSLDPPKDGNCMFSAISDQLQLCLHKQVTAAALRRDITDYLLQQRDSLSLIDGSVVHLSEKVSHSDVVYYLHNMAQPGTFGDHMMLLGKAKVSTTLASLPAVNKVHLQKLCHLLSWCRLAEQAMTMI